MCSNTLFLRTASAIDTFYTFFFRVVVIMFLVSELLSFGLSDECESKNIAIRVKKSER